MGVRCPIRPLDDRVPRGGRASLRGRVRARINLRKRCLRGRPDNRATTLAGVRRGGVGGHLSGNDPASIAEVTLWHTVAHSKSQHLVKVPARRPKQRRLCDGPGPLPAGARRRRGTRRGRGRPRTSRTACRCRCVRMVWRRFGRSRRRRRTRLSAASRRRTSSSTPGAARGRSSSTRASPAPSWRAATQRGAAPPAPIEAATGSRPRGWNTSRPWTAPAPPTPTPTRIWT